jgi:O-antigen ligase
MFAFLALVLATALLRFGGTEPAVGAGCVLLFAAGGLVFALRRVRTGEPIEVGLLLLAAGAAAIALLTDPRLALGPMAGAAAWAATRRNGTSLVRFFHALVAIGLVEALLGLFQHFVAPGWIPGYASDRSGVSGTLINRNHFAGLLGMLVPVAIGMAYTSWVRYRDPARTYLYLLAASTMGLALAFSLSRMGIVAFLLTLGLMATLVRWTHSGRLGPVFALVPLFLVLGGAAWIGVDAILERFGDLVGPEGRIEDSREVIFRDTIRMIADNPLGIGVGAYRDVFRRYQTGYNHLLFDHAHNDYLETAAEWGLLPSAVFWAGIFFVFGRTIAAFLRSRDPVRRGVLLASSGAMSAILLHSLTDFNLQIPANAMLFGAFVGIAAATSAKRGARSDAPASPDSGSRAAPIVMILLALAVLVRTSGPFMGAWFVRGARPDPASYRQALDWDPGNAEYHFRLGELHHLAIPYRDPDLAGAHYRTAVELNPERTAYWQALARLEEETRRAPEAAKAMTRALETDPNDAATRWAAGNLYLRLGDLEAADRELARAAALDPAYVRPVLDLAWTFYGDPARTMETFVPNTRQGSLIALSHFLGLSNDTGAALAWERVRSLPTEQAERLGYVDFLVSRGRTSEAWEVFLGETGEPPRPVLPEVFNGSFERETLNGGFDWRYAPPGRTEVRRDTTQSRDGGASLLIRFRGEENLDYRGVSHWLAVEEGQAYELTFWMRTEGISTDRGVYVEVDGQTSPPVLGTTFWEQFRIPFRASGDLVTIRVRRDPSRRFDNLLSGRVWLDLFELAETP